MSILPFTPEAVTPRLTLYARDYQIKAVEETKRLWANGERGVMIRLFTGAGKTPLACLLIRYWLSLGTDYHCMILSYENELVNQFAQEVYDFLGISPGIEMGEQIVDPEALPRIVVASRQSLLVHNGPTPEQKRDLIAFGLKDLGPATQPMCKRMLKDLANGTDNEIIKDQIERLKQCPEADAENWSRLHKFDHKKNWLVIYDEAHRHALKLKSVGHTAEWFGRNPKSVRLGMTATPKRGDGVSGREMFPAVAVDMPLMHLTKKCAVKEGWAVPYVQRYIKVDGVDFRNLKKIAGDFDEAQLEALLGEEGMLAKLCNPMLDMVSDRQTLIFSPGVAMAKNVAAFINARCQTKCPDCSTVKWFERVSLGIDATCQCGRVLQWLDVSKDGDQARSIDGTVPHQDRKTVYRAHKDKEFQFLSVCGLCREGYNDPDIAAIAAFRPVRENASSLAEQMKGRSCRPPRKILKQLSECATAEERVKLIAESEKPNALIVDLVGITGLADCASTLEIYAEGLDDNIIARAAKIIEEEGLDEEVDIQEVIDRVQKQIEEEKEKIAQRKKVEWEKQQAEKLAAEQRRKEMAEQRARAGAEVSYTAHEVGHGSNLDVNYNPNAASEKQFNFIASLGMALINVELSKRQAGRIIDMLLNHTPLQEVAYKNGIAEENWSREGPSDKQIWKLGTLGIDADLAKSRADARQLIDAACAPHEYEQKKMAEILGSADHERLTGLGKDIKLVRCALPPDVYARLVQAGKSKREALP
jgi:superfamily II DNA or RNA helicase